MGKQTFLASKPSRQSKNTNRLSIILTHNTSELAKYSVPGMREFWDKSASETVNELEKRGIKSAALLGGANINSQFFSAGLVDELWLTVEPSYLAGVVRLLTTQPCLNTP